MFDMAPTVTELISIHALLAESDEPPRVIREPATNFYPRSPCGERQTLVILPKELNDFYPRSPCGERPNNLLTSVVSSADFYPRSPCGERRSARPETRRRDVISIHALLAESDARRDSRQQPAGISIHALLAESDLILPIRRPGNALFLSTLSLRRATVHYDNYNLHCVISIHALLAESDTYLSIVFLAIFEFLSTLSLRRATYRFV